jgi:hypothetical protein
MTFYFITRRLHLYLALFLLPWFFMYGVSSIPFSHGAMFQSIYGQPRWTVKFDRPYEIEVPEDADLKAAGKRILSENGLEGTYGVHRAKPNQLNVYLHSFRSATRITYFVDQKRLLAEDRQFRWDHFLTGMHARGGFQQDSALNDAWGVAVDIVCVAMLIWIASGIYMWWKIRPTRFWGAVALGGGPFSFLVFLTAL